MAREVVQMCAGVLTTLKPLYPLDMSVEDKVLAVARKVYGADGWSILRGRRGNWRR